MRKEDFYKGVKTVGFVTVIPFMVAAGPLSGYFVGEFIQNRVNLSAHVVLLSVAVGFLAGLMEMIRILKAVARMNRK